MRSHRLYSDNGLLDFLKHPYCAVKYWEDQLSSDMADAVVEFLSTNLKELLLYPADLIFNVKDRVESLHKELSLMKAFLKDSREKRDESDYVREIVRHSPIRHMKQKTLSG